ncbi:unnamed protein product, partial [Prorocentrum cordatum]
GALFGPVFRLTEIHRLRAEVAQLQATLDADADEDRAPLAARAAGDPVAPRPHPAPSAAPGADHNGDGLSSERASWQPPAAFVDFAASLSADAAPPAPARSRISERADVETLLYAETVLTSALEHDADIFGCITLMHVAPRRRAVLAFAKWVSSRAAAFATQDAADVELVNDGASMVAVRHFVDKFTATPPAAWGPSVLRELLESRIPKFMHLHAGCKYLRGHTVRQLFLRAFRRDGRCTWGSRSGASSASSSRGPPTAPPVGIVGHDDAVRAITYVNSTFREVPPLTLADLIMALCLRPRAPRPHIDRP